MGKVKYMNQICETCGGFQCVMNKYDIRNVNIYMKETCVYTRFLDGQFSEKTGQRIGEKHKNKQRNKDEQNVYYPNGTIDLGCSVITLWEDLGFGFFGHKDMI